MLEKADYDSFNIGLELGPHNAIPKTVRGDFYRVTAPYGMFLAHTGLFSPIPSYIVNIKEAKLNKIL